MATITVTEPTTFPALILSTDITGFISANGYFGANANVNTLLNVTCLQDVTVTNGTGIFSWTDFCSASINKITTPSDNEISTNIVIDPNVFFGTSGAVSGSAKLQGISGLSNDRVEVAFRFQLNDPSANATPDANVYCYTGVGYISSVAPTVSPDAPVWVSPLTIAVNGDLTAFKST